VREPGSASPSRSESSNYWGPPSRGRASRGGAHIRRCAPAPLRSSGETTKPPVKVGTARSYVGIESGFGRGGGYNSVESRYVRTRVANADLASSGT